MNDYPLRVKIVASIAIVLAYVIDGPLLVLMYESVTSTHRCRYPNCDLVNCGDCDGQFAVGP